MAIDKSKIQKAAEKLIASGKVSPAIDEYLKILKENPKDWPLMIQIAELYLKINKTIDAIQYFQKVADHYNADGFFLKAIALYKRVNKLDPNLIEVCLKLADLYLKQGLTMDAKTQLQVVAGHYMSKNQTRDAIQTLKKLIEIEPDNLRSRNEVAKAYKNEGMIAEAVQEYIEISDELTRKNLLKESLAVLETAFKLDPRNASILRKILGVYTEQHEMGKALALLEDALKADASNPQVLGLLADTYAGKNQFERAHHTIDLAIQNTTDKEPFWTAKGDYYLKQGDLISAFEQYESVVERLGRRKELEKAVSLLQKIIKVDSSFHPALQKILEFHTALRQESNVISTYNSLIDAYISKTMYQEAADCLEKLIALEPDNAQHQEKLDFVRSFLDKSAPAQPRKAAPAPPPVPVYEAPPAPSPPEPEQEKEFVGEDFELDINLEMPQASAPESETAAEETPVHLPPPPAARPALAPAMTTPPPALSVSAEGTEEEKEFVSEHLIEAEVFTKYGLIDKAIEQLHIVTGRYPNSVVAHQKLKEIYLEKGDRDRAVEECVLMSRMFRKQGDLDQAEDLLSEARQINPNHPSLDRAYKEMPAAVAHAPAAAREQPPAAPVVEPASVPAPPPVVHAPLPVAPAPPHPAPAPKHAAPSPSFASRKDLMSEIEKLAAGVKARPTGKTLLPKAPAPPPPPPPPSPQKVVPAPEEIVAGFREPVAAVSPGGPLGEGSFEEIDFYTAQGLMSEAHRLLMQLKEKHPDDPGVLSRLSRFEEVPVSREDLLVESTPTPVQQEPVSSLDLLNAVVEEQPATAAETLDEVPAVEQEAGAEIPGEFPAGLPELFAGEAGAEEAIAEEPGHIGSLIEPEAEEAPVEIPVMEEIPLEGLSLTPPEEISAAGAGELALEETPQEEAQPVEMKEEHAPALEEALAETMDLSDFGELSVPAADLFSEAPTEPGVPIHIAEEHPFEGKVTEEPSSESLPSSPVEFGEAVEIAESVVEAPVAGGKVKEDLDFPAERSLDDALDAAFLEDKAPAEESQKVQASEELFEEEEDFFDLAAELEEGFLNVQNAVE
ncbi:MAG TPA: tetratricopeptide repeat protein, partial [Acidobacteriota bacterium]|nr:tetratricopeptide repeat protein [Acidobacteriota bacterium]